MGKGAEACEISQIGVPGFTSIFARTPPTNPNVCGFGIQGVPHTAHSDLSEDEIFACNADINDYALALARNSTSITGITELCPEAP